MKTLQEIGDLIGFKTKSKNYRKAFYDKYIRDYKFRDNLDLLVEHDDLIKIFKLEYNIYINWDYIVYNFPLTEDFMRKFCHKLCFYKLSEYHKMSESFIIEFGDRVYWDYIFTYQTLSEEFIEKFKYKTDLLNIIKYQKLSRKFFSDNIEVINDTSYYVNIFKNYQYFDKEFEHDLKDLSLYKVKDGYAYGYKAVRKNRYSIYNFQYQYLDNTIHESHSDQSSEENSFGLSIGTLSYAYEYGTGNVYDNFVLLHVRTKISDITAIVHDGKKLRTRKLEILHEVNKDELFSYMTL